MTTTAAAAVAVCRGSCLADVTHGTAVEVAAAGRVVGIGSLATGQSSPLRKPWASSSVVDAAVGASEDCWRLVVDWTALLMQM